MLGGTPSSEVNEAYNRIMNMNAMVEPAVAPAPVAAVATSSFMTNITNCKSLRDDLPACRQTPGCVAAFRNDDPEKITYCYDKSYLGSRSNEFTVA